MTTETSPKYPVIVEGQGPVPCPFMVIGEAPGRNEIVEQRPFIGASGQLLRDTLREFGESIGITDEGIYITNAFKGDVGEGNRNPTKDELADHFPILQEEVKAVNPAGILLVGRVATNLFLPDVSLRDVQGKRIWVGDDHLYPCYHPAAVMRNPQFKEDFRFAIARYVLTTEVLSRYELRGEG